MGQSVAVTEGIRVEVESRYVGGRSNPAESRYFFAYQIRIVNESDRTARLLSRHWIITDGNGLTQHVRGPGVVGQTPQLGPGEIFEYESFCPLSTPLGAMRGEYQFTDERGQTFEVEVGEFSLEEPLSLN
jgi:ApaG protein